MNTSKCIECRTEFSVTEEHHRYYSLLDVPAPKRCPDCRQLLRTSHINQLNLFKKECDATKKGILTNYPPSCPCPVFSQEYWYSDAVDNTKFGRDFDFSRPFFDQYAELSNVVPRPALFTDYLTDENSSYTNYAGKNKNCYLIFDADENWDCYYSYGINSCKNSVDNYRCEKLELCYQSIDSQKCYSSAFLQNCEGCIDSYFLSNCISCKNCICCSNLRQKEYYFFNQPVSKAEYEEIKASLSSLTKVKELQAKFDLFKTNFPQKALRGFQNENVSGNYLTNCRDVKNSFDCRGLHSGEFCYQVFMAAKDCIDCQEVGEVELACESIEMGYGAYNIRFCLNILNQISYLTYCDSCFTGCSHLFGCIGLKRKKFCILNKEYSESDYHLLKDRIIAHMKETREWGEFFHPKLSHMPYNLTSASGFYTLTKDEALRRGYQWYEADKRDYLPQTVTVPDQITNVSDSIIKEILSCSSCKKNYRIVQQELLFYRTLLLPVPDCCWECRNKERISKRSVRKLWEQNCANCQIAIQAAYDPAKKETVFCDSCYLESLD